MTRGSVRVLGAATAPLVTPEGPIAGHCSQQKAMRSATNLPSRTGLVSPSRRGCWWCSTRMSAASPRAAPTLTDCGTHATCSGRGRCVLRSPGGPVDLDRHALRVGSRLDQVKRNVRARVGEQPRALTDDNRDDEQVHLV